MLEISLQNLAKILGAGYQGKSNIFAQGVAIDSRKVREGDLFFALKGEKVDGHQFIEQALEKGAVGAVISNVDAVSHPEAKNLIVCQDPVNFLQKMAKLIRQNVNIPVIAITGSTGKTTTKDLTFSILQKKFKTKKTEGNYNNELGLPITLCETEKDHAALILEMGMRGLGQISFLCDIALPQYGIITNIGHVHAEILGSQEKIAQAKAELLQYIPPEGKVFLNIKDKKILEPWLSHFRGNVLWFGLAEDADIRAINIKYFENGSMFTVCINNAYEEVTINIPGEHNIINTLAAIGVARSLEVTWEQIRAGLTEVNLTEMRLQINNSPQGVKIINDTYNANPTSMEAAVKVLASYTNKRKVAVLGDMYELGIYEEQGHKLIGQVCKEKNIDLLLAVGELGRLIGLGALEKGMAKDKVLFADNNEAARKLLKDKLKQGDVVLIKGSRGMQMEKIVKGLTR